MPYWGPEAFSGSYLSFPYLLLRPWPASGQLASVCLSHHPLPKMLASPLLEPGGNSKASCARLCCLDLRMPVFLAQDRSLASLHCLNKPQAWGSDSWDFPYGNSTFMKLIILSLLSHICSTESWLTRIRYSMFCPPELKENKNRFNKTGRGNIQNI